MTTPPILARVETVGPGFYITSQLSADELMQAKAAGFHTLINNRPDFEGGPDQPTSAELEAAARAAGLVYHHLPVAPSCHAEDDARRMAELAHASPGPVLAFCRSGKRAAALYLKGKSLP